MLKVEIIGHIGADLEIKEKDGRKFGTLRVAHSERWKGMDGVLHESTQWIDVVIDPESAVAKYLKSGTLVYVRGNMSTRIYSSTKDRCNKVGITIRCQEIQLLSAAKKEDEKEQEQSSTDAPF